MTMLGRRAFLGAIAAAPAILGARQAGAGPNDHDKDVMAARGQISNADLLAADVYYWSGEITSGMRNDWNAYVAKYRNVWDTAHPRTYFSINDKTRVRMGDPGYNHWPWIESTDAEKVANPLPLSQDGVLRFRHRDGWLSASGQLSNFRKVSLYLTRRASHPKWNTSKSYNDYHLENVDYESGFTFWQGGTPQWMLNKHPGALWQIHGGGVVIYFRIDSKGRFSGFTTPKPGASSQSFPSFAMTKGHGDIHVLRLGYRLGNGGYLRIWYNGALMVNVARPMTGFKNPYQVFMSYRSSTGATERILYMDRCYRTAV
jgi:hypothetical protein